MHACTAWHRPAQRNTTQHTLGSTCARSSIVIDRFGRGYAVLLRAASCMYSCEGAGLSSSSCRTPCITDFMSCAPKFKWVRISCSLASLSKLAPSAASRCAPSAIDGSLANNRRQARSTSSKLHERNHRGISSRVRCKQSKRVYATDLPAAERRERSKLSRLVNCDSTLPIATSQPPRPVKIELYRASAATAGRCSDLQCSMERCTPSTTTYTLPSLSTMMTTGTASP